MYFNVYVQYIFTQTFGASLPDVFWKMAAMKNFETFVKVSLLDRLYWEKEI